MTLAYKPLMRGTYNPKILLDGCKPPSEGEFPMWEFLNKTEGEFRNQTNFDKKPSVWEFRNKTKHLSNNRIISKCHVMK